MNLLFSENLPLRTTRDLGDFSASTVLPHRLGDLSAARFPLIKLTATRWFAADHPMVITGVYVADQETAGWAMAIESDGKGHSWTVVNLAAPAPDGQSVSAVGRGKLDDVTGALIENPGDVFAYIAQLAGRTERWDALRAECAAAGLRIAMSLAEVGSIRSFLSRVAQSVGAIWTPEMGRLYPAAVSGPVLPLERFEVSIGSPTATLVDTCDVLRIAYDVADASARPQKHMELTASPQRLGGLVLDLTLPLLRSPTDAESVGRRYMQRLAGEHFAVPLTVSRSDIRPGAWTRLVDNPAWPLDGDDAPTMIVLAVDVEPGSGGSQLTCEYLRYPPLVTVTAHSIALPDTTQGGIDVEFRNGLATIRITDPDGHPIKDARVALDGGLPHTTDNDGVASFITTRGTHALSIEAPGFTAQQLQIEL